MKWAEALNEAKALGGDLPFGYDESIAQAVDAGLAPEQWLYLAKELIKAAKDIKESMDKLDRLLNGSKP